MISQSTIESLKAMKLTAMAAELERQLEGLLMDFLSHVAASRGLYARVSAREAELLLRYHCGGVMFLLRDWKEQDTAELDAIAHRLYQMMIREENPL